MNHKKKRVDEKRIEKTTSEMESWYANEWQIKVWKCVATDGNGAADWLRSVAFGVLTTRDERIDFEIRVTDADVDSIPLLLFCSGRSEYHEFHF